MKTLITHPNRSAFFAVLLIFSALSPQQNNHVERGQLSLPNGKSAEYSITRLAATAFPQLPEAVRA